MNKHRGSSFDDFLREEGMHEEAVKRAARMAAEAYVAMEKNRDIQAEMQKADDDYKAWLESHETPPR